MTTYITDTSFSSTLRSAIDQFQKALAKRWRKEVAEKIEKDEFDFPTRFHRSVSPHTSGSTWEYWRLPARHHIVDGCSYIEWAKGEQDGGIGSVKCEGSTGTIENVELVDMATGEAVTIPPNIECGMGSVLGQIEDWAFGECEHIFYQLPLFDSHDQLALQSAHNDLVNIGERLGLETKGESAYTLTNASERELGQSAEALAGRNGVGKHWWEGWTGLSAEQAADGFFASVIPTVNNQSEILGYLANLYSLRASIIEMGRNNTLHAIQRATESVDATVEVTTDNVPSWKVVQGIGTAITIGGGWSGVAAGVGAGVILFGFIGENLIGETTETRYAQELDAIVNGLNDKIKDINEDLADAESSYSNDVSALRNSVFGIHSFNLELYDLTENSATGGGRGEDGFTADVSKIMEIGHTCFKCGEIYENLLSTIARVSEADPHLADKDGKKTTGDTNLIEARDELEQFLRTTCGRFYTAGEQTIAAADAYSQTDMGERSQFTSYMDSWDKVDPGSRDYSVDPDALAEDTDRSGYDPYEGHPARGGAEPGQQEETDYWTELSHGDA